MTGNERSESSESDKEYDAITKAGPTKKNRRKPMNLPTPDSSVGRNSDNEDDSDFGKAGWEIPTKDDYSLTKEEYDTDSDSDAVVSKVIDRVSSQVYSGKGYNKNNPGGQYGDRGGRNGGRGGGGRGDSIWGRGRGRGRGGGGDSSDKDSASEDEIIPTRSHKKHIPEDHTDYTDEEAAVAVVNGAKRRKGITKHRTKRDTVMNDDTEQNDVAATPNGNGSDGENMEEDAIGDEGADTVDDADANSNEDNAAEANEDEGNSDNGDVQKNEDSDIMDVKGHSDPDDEESDKDEEVVDSNDDAEDEEHNQDTDEEEAAAEGTADNPVPLYDSKWLFEFLPKEQVDRFKIDSIVGCLATAVRMVDPKAYIVSWDNTSKKRIWSKETVPKTDAEMEHFVEDPHTSSVGTFGRLYGRLRFITSMKLMDIKLNPEFAAWIRAQGLFLDSSEIPNTRPKLIGFFDRKLPHTSRIDVFKGFLKKTVSMSRPYQIFSQTINAGDNTDLKCYVYVLKADSKDAETLVKELAKLIRPTSSVRFYPWEDFRDHTELAVKRKIITDMTTYARNHASFIFHGIVANDYMRLNINTHNRSNEVNTRTHASIVYNEQHVKKKTKKIRLLQKCVAWSICNRYLWTRMGTRFLNASTVHIKEKLRLRLQSLILIKSGTLKSVTYLFLLQK